MNTFYPRSLKSTWYMENVCDYIHNSLEGAKNYHTSCIKNEHERQAYYQTFEECQEICRKNDMKPEKMYESLIALKMDLKSKRYPFNLFYDIPGMRMVAVENAIDLVSGIANRYLLD